MDIKNKFCPKCSTYMNETEVLNNSFNLSNIQTDTKIQNGLYLLCKKCSHFEKIINNILIIPHYSSIEEKLRPIHITRFIEDCKNDSRYARTKNMKCINTNCKKKNPEIIIVNYEYTTEAMYICMNCDHYWGHY